MATMTAMNRKDDVIRVISKLPHERRDFEVSAILQWLRKKSQLLQTLERSVLVDLIKNCEYKQSLRDEVVIRQGDKGDCFYIILEGCVSIYIDSKMSGEDEIIVTNEDGSRVTSVVPPVLKTQEKEVKSSNTRGKMLDRSKYGRFIIKFNAGKSFGDFALISEDCIRNASIIVDEKTEFLVIYKNLFDRCLKSFQEKEYEAVQQFVNNHEFFRRLHPRLKRLLEMSLRKESYVYDSVIIRQGDAVTGLNFIKHGEAVVTTQPARHRQQFSRLWPFESVTDLYATEFEWLREARKNAILKKYRDPNALPTRVAPVAVKRSGGYVAAEQLARSKSVTVCNIHDNEVIGDVETVLNLDTYMHTVTCTANTEIYILDHKNYDRLIVKRNPVTHRAIRDHVETKLYARTVSKQGHAIPLLNYLYYKMGEIRRPDLRKLPPLVTTKSLPDDESLKQHMLGKFIDGKAELIEPHVKGSLFYKDVMQEKARIRENIRLNIANKTKQKKASIKTNRKPRSMLALRQALEDMIKEDMIAWRESPVKSGRRKSRYSIMSHEEKDVIEDTAALGEKDSVRTGSQTLVKEEQLEFIPARESASQGTFFVDDRKPVSVSNQSAAQAWFQGKVPSYLRGIQESPDDLDINLGLSPRDDTWSPERYSVKTSSPPLSDHPNNNSKPVSVGPSTISSISSDSSVEISSTSPDVEKNFSVKMEKNITSDMRISSTSYLPSITEEPSRSDDEDVTPGFRTNPDDSNMTNIGSNKNSSYKLPQIDQFVRPGGAALSNSAAKSKNVVKNKSENNMTHITIDRQSPRRVTQEEANAPIIYSLDSENPDSVNRPSRENKLTGGNAHNGQGRSAIGAVEGHGSEFEKWKMATDNIRELGILQNRERPIFERIQRPKLTELESGDSSLSVLESRLRAFHMKMSQVSTRRSGKLPKLRRYRAQSNAGDARLRPGGRVCVQRRVCDLSKCKYHIKNHEHVRYHMTSSLHQDDDGRQTSSIVQTLMESASHGND